MEQGRLFLRHNEWPSNRSNKNKPQTESRGATVAFGAFGLKSQGITRIRSNQMEAARKTLTRTISKTGKVWIRIFTDRSITQKAAEVVMGKGKGYPVGYCFEDEEEITEFLSNEARGVTIEWYRHPRSFW